jgi:hypothetical protein
MRILAILVALGAVALCGCCGSGSGRGSGGMSDAGEKSDLNEKNFRAAMDRYFDRYGDQCLDADWLIDRDVSEGSISDSQLGPRIAALEAAGLISGTDIEKVNNYNIKGKHYTPTEAAKPFMHKRMRNGFKYNDLCWAKEKLNKIVEWEGPGKTGEYEGSVTVTYTYKLDDIADWAKRPDVQATYPQILQTLNGVGVEQQRKLKLTSLGWKVNWVN